ncbi:MAG: hypothetical protein AAF356_09590 [Planctomycetota bacterium]
MKWTPGRGVQRLIPWATPLLIAVPILVVDLLLGQTQAELFGEGGPVETAQLVIWGIAAVLALGGALIGEHPRRLVTFWLGVICVLCFARELDLHEALNPETLGDLGVRYRMDWWLQDGAPLLLKLSWAGVFTAIGAAVTLPLVFGKPDAIRALRNGSASAWILVIGCGLLAMGVVLDDLLRDALPLALRQPAEEICELIGAACFIAGVFARFVPEWRGEGAADAPDTPEGAGEAAVS